MDETFRDMPRALKPSSEPGTAEIEQGYVLLNGADGLAVTFTPEAARVTGERLIQAAEAAASDRA